MQRGWKSYADRGCQRESNGSNQSWRTGQFCSVAQQVGGKGDGLGGNEIAGVINLTDLSPSVELLCDCSNSE